LAASSTLEPHQNRAEVGFQLHVDGLRTLLLLAREALNTAEHVVLSALGTPREDEIPQGKALDTSFAAGTILCCPECGEGLYKVTTQATTQDVVLNDGTFLAPLNGRIPARDVWKPLACPRCGGRLLKDGKIHTLQHGWR
jgi:hypothetical protein